MYSLTRNISTPRVEKGVTIAPPVTKTPGAAAGGNNGNGGGGRDRRTWRDQQFNQRYRPEEVMAIDELSFKSGLSRNDVIERGIILLQVEIAKTHVLAHAFDEAARGRAQELLPLRTDGQLWSFRDGAWRDWVANRTDDRPRRTRDNGLPDRRFDRRTGRTEPLNLKQSMLFIEAVTELAQLMQSCAAAVVEEGLARIQQKFPGTLECVRQG